MNHDESVAVRIAYKLLKLLMVIISTFATILAIKYMLYEISMVSGFNLSSRSEGIEIRSIIGRYLLFVIVFVTVANLIPTLFKALMAGKGLLKYVIERVPDEVIYNCEGLAGRHYSDKLSKYLSKAQEEYGIGKDEIRVLRIWYSYFWEIQHKKQYHKGNGKERKEETLQPIQWDEETSEVLSWREKEEEEERERNKSPIPEEIAQQAKETREELKNKTNKTWL